MTNDLPLMSSDAAAVLDVLFPSEATGYVEVRTITRGGEIRIREFFEVEDADRAYRRCRLVGRFDNIYVSVAPRVREEGLKSAVEVAFAVWADLDRPNAAGVLACFACPPTHVVTSGTEGHLHAYWVLDEPLAASEAERINRALAANLGADPKVANVNAMMRMPGTYNFKHDPPVKAELVEQRDDRVSVDEVRRALGDMLSPTGMAPAGRAIQPTAPKERPVGRLLDRLEGVSRSGRGWRARCPAHDDRNPSLSITEGDDGKAVVKCFAGCPVERVVAAVGMTMADLFPGASGGQSAASRLVDLAASVGVELFHDDVGQNLASIPIQGHRELERVGSDRFRRWLRQEYRRVSGRVVNAQALADAVDVLAGIADFDGPQRRVFARVARHEDRVFLDLGDDEWRVVEVTANGWAVRAESPVPFLRHNATLPLPEPARDGSLEELRDFLNLPDERSWRLVVTFLVMLLQPSGPFPILVVQGEQGSGKTTTARAVRLLIDPVKAMLRAGSPSERDLMISASRQWLLGFDNVSKLTDRLSDALCQLSTGAGFATRQLYTDADEVVMEATRGLLLNGIAGIADRPDFASRALVIVLPQIPAGRRRSEGEFWETFEQARPGILGALLDTLAGVLKVLPSIELQAAPRLADFAKVGTAVERVLGWPDGSFLKALEDTQAGAMSDALDAEPVAAPIIAFASKRKEWSGTPTQLYTALAAAAGEDQTRRREWPGNPSQLGMRLRRIAPSLRNAGVEFDDGSSGRDRDKQRHYTLTWTPSDGDDDGDNGDASA